jgi:hypothetical protein
MEEQTPTLHLSECPEAIQRLVEKLAEQFQESATWPTGNELHLLRQELGVTDQDFNAFGHSAFEFYSDNGRQFARLNLWALYDTGRFEKLFAAARTVIERAFDEIKQTRESVTLTRDDIARQVRRPTSDRYLAELQYVFSRSYFGYQLHPDHGWELVVDVSRSKFPTPSIDDLFLQRPASQRFVVRKDIFTIDATKLSMNKKVFVVHGRDAGAKETVARYITQLKLEPVILHEQANKGRTIAEKLEDHGDVGFAVVLLTADDLGQAKGSTEPLQDRARQNVILELGYFWARLGRERVCALVKGRIERPSDYENVVYVDLDEANAWKMALAKELAAAGYEIDAKALLGLR